MADRGRSQQIFDNSRLWRSACLIEVKGCHPFFGIDLCFFKEIQLSEQTACFADIFLESPSSRA
jgi:hypothetical protein